MGRNFAMVVVGVALISINIAFITYTNYHLSLIKQNSFSAGCLEVKTVPANTCRILAKEYSK